MTVRIELCPKCGEPILVEVHRLPGHVIAEYVLRCERCTRDAQKPRNTLPRWEPK